ncbi:hypothetical protein [Antrihabitans spumae]|uniref:Uncharacterized protein n=1 Tax=Antrihabitans spumae TaxID=3373370 RepID=A0ABW7KBI3_9NOCA
MDSSKTTSSDLFSHIPAEQARVDSDETPNDQPVFSSAPDKRRTLNDENDQH